MIPYIPETAPMTGDQQADLLLILKYSPCSTPADRLRTANRILDAGFKQRVPMKVSRFQLWGYAIETIALAYAAYVVFGVDRPFVFGALCSITAGSALTFIGALIINHEIKTGVRK